jgi:hypothetical protein
MYPTISHDNYDWGSVTAEETARLNAIGVSLPDFATFRDQFIGSPFDYAIDSGNGHRNVAKGALRNSDLIEHLEGRHIVSTRCRRVAGRYYTPWLWFDIDAGADQCSRYDRLRESIPTAPVVFRSSGSGGLHCLFRLDEPTPLLSLHSQVGRGLISRVLATTGLELREGTLELYPQPFGVDWRGNAIRAPFGKGSFLLDPVELVPFRPTTVAIGAQLGLFAAHLAEGRIESISLAELQAIGNTGTSKRGRPTKRSPARRGRAPSLVADECERLDAEGLSGEGQLNASLFALSTRSASRRVPLEDARTLLHGWLDERHNRQSRTYNLSPASAHAEADYVLERAYATYEPSRPWAPAVGLSAEEVALLNSTVRAGDTIADDDGVAHPRLKYLRFLFSVTDGMKSWVLTRAMSEAAILSERIGLGTAEFERAFDERVRPWWPFVPTPTFYVDSPYSFRRAVRGVSEGTMNSFWRLARESGQFPVARTASEWGGRCAAYVKVLDFRSPLYPTLEAALARSLPRDRLADCFGPYGVRRILSATEPAMDSSWPWSTRIREYVMNRLAGAPSLFLSTVTAVAA